MFTYVIRGNWWTVGWEFLEHDLCLNGVCVLRFHTPYNGELD